MKKIILSLLILCVFAGPAVYACEPCLENETLDFEETVKQADLIIEGERSGSGPLMGLSYFPEAADWIEVKILNIFKGEEEKEHVRVNSWNGMCGYGIVVDKGRHIMFLSRTEGSFGGHEYDAVKYGCSVKTYSIDEKGMISIEDNEISLNEFIDRINRVLNGEGE